MVALQLAVFLGFLGVHRWYLGKGKTGVLQAMTCGGMGLWWLYDVYCLAFQPMADGEGLPLEPPVFRNLAKEEQQRLVDEVIDADERRDRQRFLDELQTTVDDERMAKRGEEYDQKIH